MAVDSTIVSESMCAEPNAKVLVWMDDPSARELFTTAVTDVEVRTGIAFLPMGKRRHGLAEACERAFGTLFSGRVLPFDGDAARAYAEIASARRVLGRPVSQADCQIAAVARSCGMAVATRNIRDFEDMGIEILDPWNSA